MDFLEPALPLKADCFTELDQFKTVHQTYNIKKKNVLLTLLKFSMAMFRIITKLKCPY